MNARNAIKKLGTVGKVNHDAQINSYWAVVGEKVISFYVQNDRAMGFHTKRVGAEADPCTDYYPGMYWPNLTQAIRAAQRA